jgi:hypothetical protein
LLELPAGSVAEAEPVAKRAIVKQTIAIRRVFITVSWSEFGWASVAEKREIIPVNADSWWNGIGREIEPGGTRLANSPCEIEPVTKGRDFYVRELLHLTKLVAGPPVRGLPLALRGLLDFSFEWAMVPNDSSR